MSYYIRQSVLTIIWLIVALLLVMSLISYSANDPSWSHINSAVNEVSNLAGTGGAWLADILYAFWVRQAGGSSSLPVMKLGMYGAMM